MNACFSRFAFLTALTALLLASSCSKTFAPQQEQPAAAKPVPSMPNVKVTAAVKAKAELPKPGPSAAKKAVADTFGKGKASIVVKGHPDGVQHSFWSERLDVDGSGNPVQVDEVWDNGHKVLYVSNDRNFGCGNGQSAGGSTLMAVYGKGNTLHRPTGSGWWVTELDAGACGVPEGGLYGCKFDDDGNNTDCGVGTIQSETDDLVIVPLPGGSPNTSGSVPSSQDSASTSAIASGCGSTESAFEATSERSHPVAPPRAGKAIVYFFQDDQAFESRSRPTVDWGLDGQWDGATQENSYFYDYVDPGQHRVCTLWRGGMVGGRLSDSVLFTAEAGKVYYFRLANVFSRAARVNGARLTLLDDDEAQALLAKSRQSHFQAKK